jgi:hypothetical protein
VKGRRGRTPGEGNDADRGIPSEMAAGMKWEWNDLLARFYKIYVVHLGVSFVATTVRNVNSLNLDSLSLSDPRLQYCRRD